MNHAHRTIPPGAAARACAWVLACVLATLASAACAQGAALVFDGIDLSARVRHALLPGGTVYDQTILTPATLPTGPAQSAELLHRAPTMGWNFSNRSNQIPEAFGSALTQSDGFGGVGVSAWLAGNPGGPSQNVSGQLVAQSTWSAGLTFVGTGPAVGTVTLNIPALEIGLIGVAPNRSGFSATETARAEVRLDSVITHADGSTSNGGSFGFGLKAHETQLFLAPGFYSNFGEAEVIGTYSEGFLTNNDPANGLFSSLRVNSDPYNPTWTIDSVSKTLALGNLVAGDHVSFVYSITAQGTTLGGEHGFYAFLGDPFAVNAVGNGFVPGTAPPVPEPGAGALLLAGLAVLVRLARKSRGTAPIRR